MKIYSNILCINALQALLSDAEFLFAHTKCKMPDLIYEHSVYYKIIPKDKSLFGGQTGDYIFAKKPIKSAKTHFF